MTLHSRLYSEVSHFGLNEVADRLEQIVATQIELQPNEYHQNLERCLFLLEQLVEASNKLENMQLK